MALNKGMNSRFGRLFREMTAVVLERDFPEALPRPRAARLSDSFDEDEPATDVIGIPGVTVHCRADLQPQWSQSLDMARIAAEMDDNPFAVLIEYRRGRDIAESFAVMSLDQWAKLARAAQG